jgi:hypothetical protein
MAAMRTVLALLALSGLAAGKPPKVKTVASAKEALESILKTPHVQVVAFGEYHQIEGEKGPPSSLRHFIDELLPLLDKARDLVVETWITNGKCGKKEVEVAQGVEDLTKRPVETETEIVQAMKAAKKMGVQPHILELSCDEYAGLQKDGAVDPVALLGLVNDKLHEAAKKLAAPGKLVVMYGGALHNDLHPIPELERYTFGRAVSKETKGGYVEIDLYVPELVEKDKHIVAESWWPAYLAARKPGQAVVVERDAHSFIILFPQSP